MVSVAINLDNWDSTLLSEIPQGNMPLALSAAHTVIPFVSSCFSSVIKELLLLFLFVCNSYNYAYQEQPPLQ